MISKNIQWEDVQTDPLAIKVGSGGFVVLKETMGTDQTVVESARVSYGEGTKKVSDDRNLIRYLLRHSHTSPFEMCEARFLISCPLFVIRQIIRHRTANVNEISGRYSILPDSYFYPEEINYQSSDNKQGRSEAVDDGMFKEWSDSYNKCVEVCREQYNKAISNGISREQARIVLPVSQYTTFYWKCDLHNIMHFLKLRMDSHAQKEVRDYADAMYKLLENKFPLTFEAFRDYKLNSKTFSSQEIEILKTKLKGVFSLDSTELFSLSSREKTEFLNKLNS